MAKRIAICQAGLAPPLSEEFAEFGRWLEARRDAHAAALRINRYLPFFQAMDAKWGRIPCYTELVGRFHAEGLRRVRLAVLWMADAGRLVVDERAREEDSERCRIRRLEATIDASTAGGALWHGYLQHMLDRLGEGMTSLRSVRLALSAAADLARRANGREPNQADLDAYLLDRPGQKANITGFVNFFEDVREIGLVLRIDQRLHKKRERARLERQLIAMMNDPRDTPQFLVKWARVAMNYFYGRRLPVSAALSRVPGEGLQVTCDSNEYWVPALEALVAIRFTKKADLKN